MVFAAISRLSNLTYSLTRSRVSISQLRALNLPNQSVQSRLPIRYCSATSSGGSKPNELPKRGKKDRPFQVSWKSVGVAVVGFGVMLGYLLYLRKEKEQAIMKERKKQLGKASIGGAFDLVDHNGKPRKSTDFLGQWVLIYFGFTHCPDICPDEIEKMVKAVDKLEADGIKIQPLFISVDPERDNVELVKKYVGEFSPKLLGLTGTVEQVQQACRVYRVYYSAGPRDNEDDYIVDHTIIVYLVNPDGEFVDYFGQTKTFDDIYGAVALSVAKYNAMKSKWF